MTIEVTQEDIQAARSEAGVIMETCPVARATCRALRIALEAGRVLVEAGAIQVDRALYATPGVVDEFIAHFDAGLFVEPFTFEWDGPA